MTDLMQGIAAISDNADDYQIADDYYEGKNHEVFASAKLQRMLQSTGEHFRVNLAKTAVDAVSERLEIASVVVPDSDELTRVFHEKVWVANGLGLKVKDINNKIGVYGDGYVFVWPDEVEGEDVVTDDSPASAVQIVFNNPKTTRVIYDKETGTKPVYAIKLWQEEDKSFRATLYYPDRIERYFTETGADPTNANDWREFSEEEDENGDPVWPLENPYGEIPIKHFRNADPYGKPEHLAAYGPQNAINKLIITQMATTDYVGFPQRYALKEAGLAGEDEDDGIAWGGDDSQAASPKDQDQSKLKADPASLWLLEGVKSVGQFEAADPAKFMDPLAIYVRLMAQTTTTPLHYFDPSGDVPSGESLRVANAPLDKKAEDRQRRYGQTWNEVFCLAMRMLGYDVERVEITWAPSGTVDDVDAWKTIEMKVNNGVPLRQALLEANYTAQQLEAWGVGESLSDALILRRIKLLEALANATQGLAAGIGFGIFTPEDVKAIVDRVIDETSAQTVS